MFMLTMCRAVRQVWTQLLADTSSGGSRGDSHDAQGCCVVGEGTFQPTILDSHLSRPQASFLAVLQPFSCVITIETNTNYSLLSSQLTIIMNNRTSLTLCLVSCYACSAWSLICIFCVLLFHIFDSLLLMYCFVFLVFYQSLSIFIDLFISLSTFIIFKWHVSLVVYLSFLISFSF